MSVTESEIEGSELVHDPASASPLRRWVLLDGSRVALAAGLASGLLLALLALFGVGLFRPTDGESVGALLTALIGGTLPFITIVLAVIQLVLSQELGWPEGLRERFEGAEEFREDVEATAGGTVSPASPAAFLRRIVTANADRATTLPSLLVEDTEARPFDRRYTDLRVDATETPIADLRDTYELAVQGHHDAMARYEEAYEEDDMSETSRE